MTEIPITPAAIQEYLSDLDGELDPLLLQMEQRAAERSFPRLDRTNAQLLAFLVRATKARRILELGSGFGYSALWMARELPADGQIILTDRDAENLNEAREWFERDGRAGIAEFVTGDALQVLESVDSVPFDLVFMDIDKSEYPGAIDLVVPRLADGGVFCADNALWHGRVASEDALDDPATASIIAFNRAVASHEGLRSVVLPSGDGFSMSVKVDR